MNETVKRRNPLAGLLELLRPKGKAWRLMDRRDRVRFLLLFFAMIFGAVVELVTLSAIQLFAAILANGTGSLPPMFSEILAILPAEPGLIGITLAMIGILLFKLVVFAAIFWVMAAALASFRIRLATRLYRAYQFAPYLWHLQRPSADIQRSLREDINEVTNGVRQVLQFLLNFVTAIAICIFLVLALPAEVLLGLLLTIILFVAITIVSHRILVQAGKRLRAEARNMIQAIQQGFGALTEARILGKRQWFLKEFRQTITGFARAQRQRIFIQQSSPVLVETVLMIAMMLMIAAILQLSTSLEAALQIATALALAVFRLRQVLSKATNSLNRISSAAPSYGALTEDLAELEALSSTAVHPAGETLTGFDGLNFEKVRFSFPGTETAALDLITFAIGKGEHVAIVGSTGAGKSTLMELALGLLEPDSGQILVNDSDLSGKLNSWRNLIGYVPQTIYLIDDSIAANVALGIETDQIDRERVWEVLEIAGLAAHVREQQQGLDASVGEQGRWLSGGQRQRIGIARALYGGPEVLILDEATSALDRQTEAAILDALHSLADKLTIIAVTHRVDSVKFADRIAVLARGQLAAVGTYDELLRDSTQFRKITRPEITGGAG